MKIVGMDELDVNGICFSEFPDPVPLDECRERLELLISEVYEQDTEGFELEEKPEMCLSPYWVFRALCEKNRAEIARMTQAQRDEEMKRVMASRDEQLKAILAAQKKQG